MLDGIRAVPGFARGEHILMGLMETPFRRPSLFVIAVWAGAIFGLLEGIVLCISRFSPLIQAAHKVSNSALWVAPLVDIPLFLAAAAAFLVALQFFGRYLGGRELLTAYGFFIFLGILTVITMPRMIQPWGAAVFSLGLAVVLMRRLSGSEEKVTRGLRSQSLWVPLILGLAAIGTWSFQSAKESLEARALPEAQPNATNVLVIVLDTVRADHYARPNGAPLVPNLNRVAARGATFTNAWSTTSWSLPSQASILTGRYPDEHGADWPELRLKRGVATLQEFLAERGYATGAFSGNAAWITPEYLGRGFLRFQTYLFEDLVRRTVHGRKLDRILDDNGYASAGRGKKAPELISEFLKFVDDYPNRPFFSYLCFMDVNQAGNDRKFNYNDKGHAPPRDVAAAYDRGLSKLDSQLNGLFIALQQRGRLENTLVILTSDHGNSFSAENPGDHNPDDHGTTLYREQAEVPLFVVLPGKVPGGVSVGRTVSIRQIPATIMYLLNIKDSPFIGDPLPVTPSLVAEPEDRDPCVPAVLNIYTRRAYESMVCGHWQYIRNLKTKDKQGEELFDFLSDPWEKNNLADTPDSRSVLLGMRNHLDQILITTSNPFGVVR